MTTNGSRRDGDPAPDERPAANPSAAKPSAAKSSADRDERQEGELGDEDDFGEESRLSTHWTESRSSESESRNVDSPDHVTRWSDDGAIDARLSAFWSRYCPGCKRRYTLDATRCDDCGVKLRDASISLPLDETDAPEGESVGTSLSLGGVPRCPECGTIVLPGVEACPHDGTPIRNTSLSWIVADEGEDGFDDLPETLGGKWRIVRRVGEGCFGVFFEGRHDVLPLKVGIKVLRSHFTATESGRRLFHQEAMRVSQLNHPNIVKILDFGEESGRMYFVMEYLNGESLQKSLRPSGLPLLASDGSLTLPDGVRVLEQITLALVAAHGGNEDADPLVHLDLKPEHFFLTRVDGSARWHVKIIDFGIAEIGAGPVDAESSPDAGLRNVAGTLPYMAPERFRNVVDPRCDIYSLGVVLYELVAGRLPFRAKGSPAAWQRLHEEHAPAPPSSLRSGPTSPALRELDRIALWCLEKRPEDRPQSSAELARGIRVWLERQSERARRPRQRLLRLAVAALSTLLLSAALLYLGPWERLVVHDPQGTVGPTRELAVSADPVNATGYEDAMVFLEVEGASGRARLGTVDLDRVQLRVGLEALDEALGTRLPSGTVSARLVVEGALGRTLRSRSFSIRIDREAPRFKIVSSREEPGSQASDELTTVWLEPDQRLTITVSEAIDPEESSCRVGEDSFRPILGGSTEDIVGVALVSFPGEDLEGETEVTLVDLAGNRTSERFRIERIKRPRLLPQEPWKTNLDELTIKISLDGLAAKLKIVDRSTGMVVLEDENVEGDVTLTLQLAEERELRVLDVRMWSRFAMSDASSRHDVESTIEVTRLAREGLQVIPDRPPGSFLPRRFDLEDASGLRIDEEPLDWDIVLFLFDGNRHERIQVSIDASGEFDGSALQGRSGKILYVVRVEDEYHNQANFVSELSPLGVDDPQVDAWFEPQPGSDPGSRTRALTLRHRSCLFTSANPEFISLGFQVNYEFEHDVNIRFKDTGLGLPAIEPLDSGWRVPVNTLIAGRDPGPQHLVVEVVDSQDGREGSVELSYEITAPISIDVGPEKRMAAGGRPTPVTIHFEGLDESARSLIKDVLVDSVTATRSANGDWVAEVPVKLTGKTTATVRVQAADGTPFDLDPIEILPAPVSDHRYAFDTPRGPLVLRYEGMSDAPGFFWRETRELHTFDEARAHVDRLNAELSELLHETQGFAIQSVSEARRLRGKTGPHTGWVDLRRSEPDATHAAVESSYPAWALGSESGVVEGQGPRARRPFRIVLPYTPEKGWFQPSNASDPLETASLEEPVREEPR